MLTDFEKKIFTGVEEYLDHLPSEGFSDTVSVFLDSILEFLRDTEFVRLQDGVLGEHSDEFQAIRTFADRAYLLREAFNSLALYRGAASEEVAAYRDAATREADAGVTPAERGRLRKERLAIGARLTGHFEAVLGIARQLALDEEDLERAVLGLERYFRDGNPELQPPLPDSLTPYREAFVHTRVPLSELAQYAEHFRETAQRLHVLAAILAKPASKHPRNFSREAGFRSGHEQGIPVRETYRDEQVQHPSKRAKDQPPGTVTTHYALDAEELRASEVVFPEDGSTPRLKSGGPLPGTGGWVMLAGGTFHVFDPDQVHVFDNGKLVSTLTSLDDYGSVVSRGHTIRLMHHSSLASGKEIVAGGMFTLKAKTLDTATWFGSADPESYGALDLDNWSGHYQPTAADMGRAARRLAEQGGGRNTSVTLKGLTTGHGRQSDGLEEIARMKARVDEEDWKTNSPFERKAKYPYNDGDSTVPFSVMAHLGENADVHTVKFHERVQAELKDTFAADRPDDGAPAASQTGQTTQAGAPGAYGDGLSAPPGDVPYQT
ncbi:hypothetical protein ACFXPI_02420 [Streptomyces sp. NPDC059104]|uniref:hypothetical protein n=1 Tax=Streptomyces sp. NPDC059104 TaxID=3346729 RepID=UPI0036C6B470